MTKLHDPRVQGALRHFLTALGPMVAVLMASDDPVVLLISLIEPQNWTALVGLLMALIGFWASWTAREKRRQDDAQGAG